MAYFENGISSDSLNLLKKMGHQISPQSRVFGSTQSISLKGNNLKGSADSRRQGASAIAQKP
jgi:gamma-glutamyltranspeptidase